MKRLLVISVLLATALAYAGFRKLDRRDRRWRAGMEPAAAPAPASAYELELLPTIAAEDECTGSSLSTVQGGAVTFDRDTSAVCTKSDGTLVTLDSDEPRLEGTGLVVESAATNLMLRSEEFDDANWAVSSAGSGGVMKGTANSAVAPDGTTTADEIVFTGDLSAQSCGTTHLQIIGRASSSTGTQQALSIWVKKSTGTGTIYMWGNGGGPTSVTACSISTTWTRCTHQQASVSELRLGWDIRNCGVNPLHAVPMVVYIWGAQAEAGTVASSYIKTTSTTVARNADNASVDKPDAVVDAEGCAAATVTANRATSDARILSFASGGSPLLINSSTVIRLNDGTNNTSATADSSIVNRTVALRSGWRASDDSAVVDVVTDGETGTGTYDDTMVGSAIYLGSTSGSSNFLNGRIKDVRFDTSKGGCL